MLGATFSFKYLENRGIFAFRALDHVDDPMLAYYIPFDMNGYVGAHDIALNEMLTARCGRGFWVHNDDMPKFANPIGGNVGPNNVSLVKEKLAQMVNPTEQSSFPSPEEFNEFYEGWMDKVNTAVETLIHAIGVTQ